MQSRVRRIAVPLLALALLALGCSNGTTIDELIANSSTPAPDSSSLPIDDDYRIGTLPNGLTYLLRSNNSPGSSLDLRLVVNAGSRQQRVGDDGSAHFLEHMLFNGTASFPGNQLRLELQSLGISFGPELNAFTSYDETVYLLTAGTRDSTAVDTAFEVLAEWASAATIDPDEVEAEIGVVRDELRQSRESVDGIIFDEFERIYTEGTDYENHIVLGDPDKVEATTAAVLRDYYDAWYRPDNMAVVAVGDLSLDELEDLVEQHFSTLEARVDDPPVRDDVNIEISAEPLTAVVTHPDNAFDNLSLDFPLPIWDRRTVRGDRLLTMEAAIGLMVTNRLGDAFLRGDLDLEEPPFLEQFEINRELRYAGTNIKAADLASGLDQFLGQLMGVAEGGFTTDDLARAQAALLAGLDDAAATLDSTQDQQYADALMTYWLAGADLDDPLDSINRRRKTIESFTPAFTPREVVSELDRYIVGQARCQARCRDCPAQPLAPTAGAGRAARRDRAKEHHHDRSHRRRARPRSPDAWRSSPRRRSSRWRPRSSPRWATSAATSSRSCAT